jgi:hypothetical protein
VAIPLSPPRKREGSYIPNNFASDFSSMKNCQINRPWSRRPD